MLMTESGSRCGRGALMGEASTGCGASRRAAADSRFGAGTYPLKSSDGCSATGSEGFPEDAAATGATDGLPVDFTGAGLASGFFDGCGFFLPNSEKTTVLSANGWSDRDGPDPFITVD